MVSATLLADNEAQIQDAADVSNGTIITLYKRLEPIHMPATKHCAASEIRFVRVAGTDIEANLNESASSILARSTGKPVGSNPLENDFVLRWPFMDESFTIEGDEPVRV